MEEQWAVLQESCFKKSDFYRESGRGQHLGEGGIYLPLNLFRQHLQIHNSSLPQIMTWMMWWRFPSLTWLTRPLVLHPHHHLRRKISFLQRAVVGPGATQRSSPSFQREPSPRCPEEIGRALPSMWTALLALPHDGHPEMLCWSSGSPLRGTIWLKPLAT